MWFKWFVNLVVAILTIFLFRLVKYFFIPPLDHFQVTATEQDGKKPRGHTLCLAAISFPWSWVIFLKCIRSTLLATKIIGKDSLKDKKKNEKYQYTFIFAAGRGIINFKSFHKTIADVRSNNIIYYMLVGNVLQQHFTPLIFYRLTASWIHGLATPKKTFDLEAGGHLPILNSENELMEPIHMFKAGFICDRINYKEAISRPHVLLSHCTEFFLTSSVQD